MLRTPLLALALAASDVGAFSPATEPSTGWEVLHPSPQITLHQSLLTDKTVDHLLASLPTDEGAWGQCTGTTEEWRNLKGKQCAHLPLASDPTLHGVVDRIESVYGIDASALRSAGLPIIRYAPGAAEVYPHSDCVVSLDKRVPNATLVLYLTSADSPGSGVTYFSVPDAPGGRLSVTPVRGAALAFTNIEGADGEPLPAHGATRVSERAPSPRYILQVPITDAPPHGPAQAGIGGKGRRGDGRTLYAYPEQTGAVATTTPTDGPTVTPSPSPEPVVQETDNPTRAQTDGPTQTVSPSPAPVVETDGPTREQAGPLAVCTTGRNGADNTLTEVCIRDAHDFTPHGAKKVCYPVDWEQHPGGCPSDMTYATKVEWVYPIFPLCGCGRHSGKRMCVKHTHLVPFNKRLCYPKAATYDDELQSDRLAPYKSSSAKSGKSAQKSVKTAKCLKGAKSSSCWGPLESGILTWDLDEDSNWGGGPNSGKGEWRAPATAGRDDRGVFGDADANYGCPSDMDPCYDIEPPPEPTRRPRPTKPVKKTVDE